MISFSFCNSGTSLGKWPRSLKMCNSSRVVQQCRGKIGYLNDIRVVCFLYYSVQLMHQYKMVNRVMINKDFAIKVYVLADLVSVRNYGE